MSTALFEVTYDLHRPRQDYRTVIDTIKQLGEAQRSLASTWLVATDLTEQEVADRLAAVTDEDDRYSIVAVAGICARGLSQDARDLAHRHLLAPLEG